MSNQLVIDSLQRRMKAMHSLYHDATSTMTVEQVNYFEREGVVPIAFCLFHIVNMIDASFMLMTGAMISLKMNRTFALTASLTGVGLESSP